MHFHDSLAEVISAFYASKINALVIRTVEDKDYIQSVLEGIYLTLKTIVDYFAHLFSLLIHGQK